MLTARALSTDAAEAPSKARSDSKKEVAAAAAVELPTSDESDELLRIRHSVSFSSF